MNNPTKQTLDIVKNPNPPTMGLVLAFDLDSYTWTFYINNSIFRLSSYGHNVQEARQNLRDIIECLPTYYKKVQDIQKEMDELYRRTGQPNYIENLDALNVKLREVYEEIPAWLSQGAYTEDLVSLTLDTPTECSKTVGEVLDEPPYKVNPFRMVHLSNHLDG